MLIEKLSQFCRRWKCVECAAVFKSVTRLAQHMKQCQNLVKYEYVGGAYHRKRTLQEWLKLKKVPYSADGLQYDSFLCYDFECIRDRFDVEFNADTFPLFDKLDSMPLPEADTAVDDREMEEYRPTNPFVAEYFNRVRTRFLGSSDIRFRTYGISDDDARFALNYQHLFLHALARQQCQSEVTIVLHSGIKQGEQFELESYKESLLYDEPLEFGKPSDANNLMHKVTNDVINERVAEQGPDARLLAISFRFQEKRLKYSFACYPSLSPSLDGASLASMIE